MNILAISPFITNNNLSFNAKKPTIKNASAKKLEKDVVEFTRKLTPKQQQMFEREKTVLEMISQGLTQQEIANRLNLSVSLVNIAARRQDAFQRIKATRDKKVLDMLIQGFSRKEIAEKFGISKTTVNDIAERNDAYTKAREKRDKKILELLNKGLMAIEVAKVLGISDSTVSRVAHKNGIYLAPKRK